MSDTQTLTAVTNDVLIHADGGVLTLTLNRVDKKNSITAAMYAAMADALAQAADNPDVRVVVIQGHVTIFSAGNDIADFLNPPAAAPAPTPTPPSRPAPAPG